MNEVYRAMKTLDYVSLKTLFHIQLKVFVRNLSGLGRSKLQNYLFFQEWKVINPYHVQVRRKKPTFEEETKPEEDPEEDGGSTDDEAMDAKVDNTITTTPYYVKMSLQLYQVDYKSFLLDFKSVPNVSNPQNAPKPHSANDKRHSLTNGSNGKDEPNHDSLGDAGDKENIQEAVNGCDSKENGE